MAHFAGTGPALASERTYLRSTVPRAFARGLRPGTGTAPGTVAALATGVGAALLGYAAGRLHGGGAL